MKKILFCYFLVFPLVVFSQPINFEAFKLDSNGKIVDTSATAVKKILNREFSGLITGQSKNSIGSFAAVDLGASEVSFAGSHISKKNGSVFTLKASGAISDGFYTLFNNSTFNSQIGVELQYNFLRLKNRMLEYDADSGSVFNKKVDKIKYDFDVKNVEIDHLLDSVNLQKKRIKTEKLRKDLVDSLAREVDSLNRMTLRFDIQKTQVLLDSINDAITNFPYYKTLRRNLRNRTLDQLKALTFQSGVLGFAFGWFSVGYKVNHNKFKYFDAKLPFQSQVMDTTFVNHSVKFQYSYYQLRFQAFRSYFFDIGSKFGYSDNFALLKKKEISETINYGGSPGQRESVKKYTAYEGVYNRDLKSLTLYSDLYYFLFRNNMAAVHLNPEWIAATDSKPISNFYVGFLLAVKDAKTDNAIVNFELYYKFLDLFKTTETEYDFFERNNVGIRFAFPIAFKYNKLN